VSVPSFVEGGTTSTFDAGCLADLQRPEPTPEPAPPNLDRNQPSLANPFINPEKLNWVPDATGYVFDAVLDKASSLRRSFSPDKRFSGRRRR
jgi:hypothetical protein